MIGSFNALATHAIEEVAQEVAREFGHKHLGTEHLLVAVVQMRDVVPARALRRLGVTLKAVRENAQNVQPVMVRTPAPVPLTEELKKCLAGAPREASQLGQDYIGPEHIVLSIMRNDSAAAKAVYLVNLGQLKQAIIEEIGGYGSAMPATTSEGSEERSTTEIAAEMDELMSRLRVLTAELHEATKRETGIDRSWMH